MQIKITIRRKGWFRRARLKWVRVNIWAFHCADGEHRTYAFERIDADRRSTTYRGYDFVEAARSLSFDELFLWCRKWHRRRQAAKRDSHFSFETRAEHNKRIAI